MIDKDEYRTLAVANAFKAIWKSGLIEKLIIGWLFSVILCAILTLGSLGAVALYAAITLVIFFLFVIFGLLAVLIDQLIDEILKVQK